MAKCYKCKKNIKGIVYQDKYDNALCEDCIGGKSLCPRCGRMFDPEDMNGNYCSKCSDEVED